MIARDVTRCFSDLSLPGNFTSLSKLYGVFLTRRHRTTGKMEEYSNHLLRLFFALSFHFARLFFDLAKKPLKKHEMDISKVIFAVQSKRAKITREDA